MPRSCPGIAPQHASRARPDLPAMLVARTLDELAAHRASLTGNGRPLALVPTMGALHAGHVALVDAARRSGAAVAASIFVNPLQFGPGEDFARYPRNEAADLAALAEAGCELAWLPTVETMYPAEGASVIDVAGPAERWEGAARPGHFRGVATVCAKLFGQVRAGAACFGEKDWQQLQVVRRMVSDLHIGVEIIAVPTVRDPDGLALSSRNRYLTPAERALAPRLHATLAALAGALAAAEPATGEDAGPRLAAATAELVAAGFAPDYVALVDARTLAPVASPLPARDNAPLGRARLIAAARLGAVRLIDNVAVG
jgi:pantoate--beta-alanine ligase